MKSGHGTAFKSNGTVIKGDWKNDELAGIATINSRNGI